MLERALLILALLVTPALAQPETVTIGGWNATGVFSRIALGGFSQAPLTVIDREPRSATMQIMRFNDGPDYPQNGEFKIGARIYCRDGAEEAGGTTCTSIEFETHSNTPNTFNVPLDLHGERYGLTRMGGIHIGLRDRSGLPATEAQGMSIAESGIEVFGPEDYTHSPLGKRNGWRFGAKGSGETGTGFAALVGPRHRATLNTAFFAAELRESGRINHGYRCSISGTCLTVDRAGYAIDLDGDRDGRGSDIILRYRENGSPETLRVELARLRAQVAQLNARVVRLTAEIE